MDGTTKARLAVADANSFTRVMRRMGVSAIIPAASQRQLRESCSVYPAACCIYKIKTFGATSFSDILKFEREVRAEIASGRKALGVYDKNMSVRFDAEPFLTIEVDPPAGYFLDAPDNLQHNLWSSQVGEAFQIDGASPMIYSLSTHYQTLVAAISGHGKSVLVRNCLLGLFQSSTPEQLHTYLIDFKNDDLAKFKSVKHVKGFAWRESEAADMVAAIRTEVDNRIAQNDYKLKSRVLLVVDEGAELDKSLDDPISSIMKMGRSLGVHVLFATQYPTAAQIGVKTARAFTHRFVGRVDNASSALWASGVSGSGAESLKKPGSFLSIFGGQINRFQTYRYDAMLEENIIKSHTKYGRAKK